MLREQLRDIFRKVFEDPTLELRDDMDSSDVDKWDSLSHINMIVEVEKHFGVEFRNAEIARLRCVGDLVKLIHGKKPELQ
jgi:acyl carrier protein